jgi:hypothetical protein
MGGIDGPMTIDERFDALVALLASRNDSRRLARLHPRKDEIARRLETSHRLDLAELLWRELERSENLLMIDDDPRRGDRLSFYLRRRRVEPHRRRLAAASSLPRGLFSLIVRNEKSRVLAAEALARRAIASAISKLEKGESVRMLAPLGTEIARSVVDTLCEMRKKGEVANFSHADASAVLDAIEFREGRMERIEVVRSIGWSLVAFAAECRGDDVRDAVEKIDPDFARILATAAPISFPDPNDAALTIERLLEV